VGMTGVIVAMTWLAWAPVEVPLVDDWTYAWSVEHFLQTGELRMLEWSAHYPLAQILWGALFSRLLGFSFAVLRLSTVVLAWAGLLAFYGTLRELGIRPLLAGLGTLLLWCNPVFFVLSHSFMTDVPFISTMNAAFFGYVRWVKHGRTRDLGLGSVLATLAFLIRQLGAALTLIPFLSAARPAGRWCAPPPALVAADLAPRPLAGDRAHALVDSRGAWGDPGVPREGADAPPGLGH
jgi:hypothetical protein